MNARRSLRRRYVVLPVCLTAFLVAVTVFGSLALKGIEERILLVADHQEGVAERVRMLNWCLALTVSCALLPLLGLLIWRTRSLQEDCERTRASEEWLTTTLRSIGDAVIATDSSGRITLINEVAQQLTGWCEADARGKPLGEVLRLVARDTRQPIESPFDRIAQNNESRRMAHEALLIDRQGVERAITENGAKISGAGGAFGGVVLVFRDMTEHELAEAALRASQEMFRLITEHVSDMIAVIDLHGRRLYSSHSHSSVLGLARNLYLTESFRDVHPDDRLRVEQAFAETALTGVGQQMDYRLLKPDGSVVHVESVSSVVHDHRGVPEKVLLVSRDVTERKANEQRIREKHEFIEALINSMPGIFYLYDSRRSITHWNRNLERVSGYTAEEIPKLDPLDFFNPEDQPLVHERMLVCMSTGEADIEVSMRHRAGHSKPFYFTGLRIDVNGQPCMLGVGIDITARKRAEAEVSRTLERLQRQNATLCQLAQEPALLGCNLERAFSILAEATAHALEVPRTGIWFFNPERTRLTCARLFVKGTASQPSAPMEMKVADFPQYFRALQESRTIAAHAACNDPRTREFKDTYLRPNNIQSLLEAPIRNNGEVTGVLCHEHIGASREWTLDEQNFAGSVADLTALCLEMCQRREAEEHLRDARDNLERKVAERTRDLKQANERLKDLDRLKSQFLATMSHELRTPLNSIIGFSGILRQGLAGPVNEEQQRQLAMMHHSANHLLGLINDLLDLSRIESGKMEVNNETFLVAAVVDEVVSTLRPMVEQKALRLEAVFDNRETEITSDRRKCFQILLNLVSNAVKFTSEGSVTIHVIAELEIVELTIMDTGIGIHPDSLMLLFEPFRQVDGSAKRTYEGTGLGLYLSKQLAILLGGSIRAESVLGAGSRFTVRLPRLPLTLQNS